MAAVGEAPTLFLRKATGLVKGWSKFDAFLYSFMSVNFVTLGLFFALSVLAFVPDRTGAARAADLGRVRHVPGHHVRGADLGDAAGRRRLRVAEPRPRRRDRVRPRRHRLVVHPVVLGADLREHPERRGVPAARGDLQAGRPVRLPGDRRTACSRSVVVDGACSPGYLVSLGMEGYAKVQKVCFYIGMVGAGRRVHRDAVRLAERVRERVQPGGREPVRGEGRRLRSRRSTWPATNNGGPVVPTSGSRRSSGRPCC